jgi:hypothetical protein
MVHAHFMLDTRGYKHSEQVYEILVSPLQQWLHKRATVLCLYVECLSCWYCHRHNLGRQMTLKYFLYLRRVFFLLLT